MKRKICVVTGNRSDYVKLKPLLCEIKSHGSLELGIIVTASHLLDDFGKTIRQIEDDGFKIDATINTTVSGDTPTAMAQSVGLCATQLPTFLENTRPDIVVVMGDRFDALGVAISASLMNIPVAHIQGGEVTGTIDETIRHAITKLSHIHFVSTKRAKENVILLGEYGGNIFNYGCPSVGIISKARKEGPDRIKGYGVEPKKFILCVQHPVTTEYSFARRQMREVLEAINIIGIKTIMIYPNMDAGSKDMVREIRIMKLSGKISNVTLYKNIPIIDYMALLKHCACIVGNSSSGIRESCYFGTPAVDIGTRQFHRERGKNVITVANNEKNIVSAVEEQIRHGKYRPEYVYGSNNPAKKIAKKLASIKLDGLHEKLLCYA